MEQIEKSHETTAVFPIEVPFSLGSAKIPFSYCNHRSMKNAFIPLLWVQYTWLLKWR